MTVSIMRTLLFVEKNIVHLLQYKNQMYYLMVA